MKQLLSNAIICTAAETISSDVLIENGIISYIAPNIPIEKDTNIIQLNDCYLFPGFVDVHVHLREPGFFYKETIQTGTKAAAKGGFTTVCSMPNLNPTPDSHNNLTHQLDLIKKNAVVNVVPYGTITKGQKGEQLADLSDIAAKVVGFSDDGRGVQNAEMMELAMTKAKQLGKIIVAHCEDESLLGGGYIHDGDYAKAHCHKGISSESEWKQLERDLQLVSKTGCAYHVCHVSTKESVQLIRKAKAEGLNVTCETAPHYLLLCDQDLQEDGRFKMNPPLRSKADKDALIEGILDGTIDMIATDHAPHSVEEKSRGLKDSVMGVVGLETAFPLLYTNFVSTGVLSLNQLVALLHQKPMERFKVGSPLEVGQPADICAYNLNTSYIIDPSKFVSKGKSTPFEGVNIKGKCVLTMVKGEPV